MIYFELMVSNLMIEFKKEFFRSIYEHGLHIMKNLEWNEELRGNHYLSNIVGLLFVAAYLPVHSGNRFLVGLGGPGIGQ